MTSRDNVALANHVLQSIQKDLSFLKSQQYISNQAYDDILRILPPQLHNTTPSYTSGSPYASKATMPSPGSTYNSSTTQPPPPPNYATAISSETVEALYDFQGQNAEDLSFHRGDIIQVNEHVNNDWWRGTLNGRTGLFPSSYVQKRAAPRQEKPTPPSTPARNSMPPPPPPSAGNTYAYPPPPTTAPSYSNAPPSASYGYPPPPPQQQQYNNNYAVPPPVAQPVPEQQASGSAASKASGMMSKVGGQIANAATLGFGATLGSEAAHAIF